MPARAQGPAVGADYDGMAMSVPPVGSQIPSATSPSEATLSALARALRLRRQEALMLRRLVEQATAAGDKGQHVNYYA